jgi:hypothetical protein
MSLMVPTTTDITLELAGVWLSAAACKMRGLSEMRNLLVMRAWNLPKLSLVAPVQSWRKPLIVKHL